MKYSRDVLFEYHGAVVPFCWAVRPVRSLSVSRLLAGIPILAVFQNLIWNSNKTSLSRGRDSTKNPFHLSKQGQEPASSQEHEWNVSH